MLRKPFYYIRAIMWLWKNRDWKNTRQKWKALEKHLESEESK